MASGDVLTNEQTLSVLLDQERCIKKKRCEIYFSPNDQTQSWLLITLSSLLTSTRHRLWSTLITQKAPWKSQ